MRNMKNIQNDMMDLIRANKRIIVKNISLSIILSVIIVGLIYWTYDIVAAWLNTAIDNHSIGFLEGFDLKAKLKSKCDFDSMPSSADVQERFALFYKLFIFWFAFISLLLFAPWKRWRIEEHNTIFPKIDKFEFNPSNAFTAPTIVLCLSFIGLYMFWYWIISLSGMLGDDYYCGMTQGKPFITRIAWWVWCYATHVSRIGESIYYIFPQTVERTQHLLITPLFVALFPFVMKRFSDVKFRMNEWRGIAYYWLMGLMSFMGIVIIRILIIYAPCANYFYPVVWCLFFLSFYVRYNGYKAHSDYSTISKIAFCLLGIISGWSTEGLGVVGMLYLLLWLAYWVTTEKHVSKLHYAGIVGYLIGACNVVFSTGPIIRGSLDTNLTGGNVPYNLSVLPLWQRFTYLPEMLEAIWPCIKLPVGILVIVLLVAAISKSKSVFNKRVYATIVVFSVFVFLLCFVYIVGAIPNGSTFTPASYLMVALVGLLYARLLKDNWKVAILPLIIQFVYTVIYMYPRIEQGIVTSKAEKTRIERILKLKAEGIKEIELPYPSDEMLPLPDNVSTDRTYIPFQHFSPNASDNKQKADFFGVTSIKEQDFR